MLYALHEKTKAIAEKKKGRRRQLKITFCRSTSLLRPDAKAKAKAAVKSAPAVGKKKRKKKSSCFLASLKITVQGLKEKKKGPLPRVQVDKILRRKEKKKEREKKMGA